MLFFTILHLKQVQLSLFGHGRGQEGRGGDGGQVQAAPLVSRVELDHGKFASTYYKKLASARFEPGSEIYKRDALTDCAKARL